jgi:ubiquitin-protein ligase
MAARANRMSKELKDIETKPPEGVSAWPVGDCLFNLGAKIHGPPDTVYEEAWFELAVDIPEM